MIKTSDRIKEALKERRMKAIDLSRKTGISSGMISEYMNDKYQPRQENLYKIAEALNVSIPWLMGFDTFMERERSLYDINDTEKFIKNSDGSINIENLKIAIDIIDSAIHSGKGVSKKVLDYYLDIMKDLKIDKQKTFDAIQTLLYKDIIDTDIINDFIINSITKEELTEALQYILFKRQSKK